MLCLGGWGTHCPRPSPPNLAAPVSLPPNHHKHCNTARSFGASAVAGIWTDHWLFWFGPMTGAVAAALMYELVFKSRKNWENKYLPFAQA